MKTERKLMLGNEALARGLVENGCAVATSYPGTPASEILSAVAWFKKQENLPMHVQWAINEKVAFEIAYSGSIAGLRTAVSMKQVGLNVASDPLMSAAYLGNTGGFVIISADDPGPHSSQTEQDSRLMAMAAKIPVLDPDSPARAKKITRTAFGLSEEFEIPVMIRPTTRICHSRQDIRLEPVRILEKEAGFEKDPARWAATPKFRYRLHHELEKKLETISRYPGTAPERLNPGPEAARALIVSGVAGAHAVEIMRDLDLWNKIPIYRVLQPFPLHETFIPQVLNSYEKVLVLEESMPVIEMQLANRDKVRGRIGNHVPRVGELLPETIHGLIGEFAGIRSRTHSIPAKPGKRPTLCAGCPHRASFFAIKKAAPRGIYTSDIGCYTLGMNLGAVDTVLCMGAAVSQAAGFFHAFKDQEKPPPIVATMGDSTFFHSGIPPLIDAVAQKVAFVLVILDNRTTAMTGNQPTPATGIGACGETLARVDIESIVRGCGVGFCESADPYELKDFTALVKQAVNHCRENEPAVVISRHPCLIGQAKSGTTTERCNIQISDECDGCAFCVDHFECPALLYQEAESRVSIDFLLCTGCGVCVRVCPKKNIMDMKSG